MQRSLLTMVLSLLVLVPPAAHADVTVSYTVDDKALKAAIAGTPLGFALYSDSSCSTFVDGTIDFIENVDLIERVKRFKVKNGPKPPNTVRLTHTLTGVSSAPALYLAVSGVGVVPVGGVCQPQYGSISGVPCATQVGTEVFFTGCNVNVRDGSGSTAGAVNGRGNLIIGYNEDDGLPMPNLHTGSHNLVVGQEHSYSSYGGFVAGLGSRVSAANASVCGGENNIASGSQSTVSGGEANTASGPQSTVSGGVSNQANNFHTTVSGGGMNTASGFQATVSGGDNRSAAGPSDWVGGGLFQDF